MSVALFVGLIAAWQFYLSRVNNTPAIQQRNHRRLTVEELDHELERWLN